MGKRIFIILLFLNSCLLFKLQAQTVSEIEAHQHVMAVPSTPKAFLSMARGNKNEAQLVLSGLFLFYKNFISSQDGVSCVFTPSCSEYALMAVKKQGIVTGMANAADRMTRCHGLSPEKYQKAENSLLMIDEVK